MADFDGGSAPAVYLVLDTNILLHFRPLREIDWSSLVQSPRPTIVIPAVVLRELDNIKDSHGRGNIRQRALNVAKDIEEFVFGESGKELRFVMVDRDEPLIDFASIGLSRDVNDDHVLATLLELMQEQPGSRVCLVSNDVGPRLKARKRGIEVLQLDEKYKLPPALDENEKERRELQKKVAQLESRLPKLTLLFDNSETFLAITVKPDSAAVDQDAQLKEVKGKYRPIQAQTARPSSLSDLSELSELAKRFHTSSIFGSDRIGDGEYERYNAELVEFYREYELYLAALNDYHLKESLSFDFSFLLRNSGSAPANDIDLHLHFPDGFVLESGGFERGMPSQPRAPLKPRSEFEINTSRLAGGMANFNLGALSSYAMQPRLYRPSNVSDPDIKRTNSYDIRFRVGRCKQHVELECCPLYLTFDSIDDASSFSISYEINCADAPELAKGSLHVRVERQGV